MKIGLMSSGLDAINLSRKEVSKKLRKIGYDAYDYTIHYKWATPNPIFSESRDKWVNHFKEERKIIEGEVTPEFVDMILGMPKPTDVEIYNKMTPFFNIFLDDTNFQSCHYGTEIYMEGKK